MIGFWKDGDFYARIVRIRYTLEDGRVIEEKSDDTYILDTPGVAYYPADFGEVRKLVKRDRRTGRLLPFCPPWPDLAKAHSVAPSAYHPG